MRISDWSSDVCSSDLPVGRRRFGDDRNIRGLVTAIGEIDAGSTWSSCNASSAPAMTKVPTTERGADRQSVVQGKSVSVRVDLGGRRLIKKTHHGEDARQLTHPQPSSDAQGKKE